MSKKKEFENLKLNVNDLIPYANNSRTHSDKQINQIASSIKEFGFTNPVIIDEDNGIIAGHGRILAAKKLNIEQVPCVKVTGWTEAQKKAYVIADNKLALNAGWDEGMLSLEINALEEMDFDISLLGFDDLELDGFLKYYETVGLTDEDDVPDVQDTPVTIPGDVWILGEHRLMCGDSTDAGSVAVLMNGQKADMVFTDPPYGVNAIGARGKVVKAKNIKKIQNDNLKKEELTSFIVNCLKHDVLKKGASFYVCYDQKTQIEFCIAIRQLGWNRIDTIIWNKNVFGLNGKKGYRPKFEMIAFGSVCQDFFWYADKGQANVWDIARSTERPGNHPTPKPVELIERALFNSSKQGDLVMDLFLGSGSTLIAAEKTGRKCYGMELDPKYCDVIIKRWQDFTGKKATMAGDTYEQVAEARGVTDA